VHRRIHVCPSCLKALCMRVFGLAPSRRWAYGSHQSKGSVLEVACREETTRISALSLRLASPHLYTSALHALSWADLDCAPVPACKQNQPQQLHGHAMQGCLCERTCEGAGDCKTFKSCLECHLLSAAVLSCVGSIEYG
jgi:hypothetical protein